MKTKRTYTIETTNAAGGDYYYAGQDSQGKDHWSMLANEAQVFSDSDDLPSYLNMGGPEGTTLEKEVFADSPDQCDIRYYAEDAGDGDEAVAVVRMYSEETFDDEDDE